jgi:hypothetical protein
MRERSQKQTQELTLFHELRNVTHTLPIIKRATTDYSTTHAFYLQRDRNER